MKPLIERPRAGDHAVRKLNSLVQPYLHEPDVGSKYKQVQEMSFGVKVICDELN